MLHAKYITTSNMNKAVFLGSNLYFFAMSLRRLYPLRLKAPTNQFLPKKCVFYRRKALPSGREHVMISMIQLINYNSPQRCWNMIKSIPMKLSGHPFHAIKLRGFPLEEKKTPFGVLSLIPMRFIPQLKSWGFLAWIGLKFFLGFDLTKLRWL